MVIPKNASPLQAFVIVFLFSLVAALILYGLFESTGAFETKEMRLGGAAAGFVVFLIVSTGVFLRLSKGSRNSALSNLLKETQDKIAELELENRTLRDAQIPDIRCPDGFEIVFVRDLGVGFARPSNWTRHPEVQLGTFLRPLEPGENKELSFQGNLNITAALIDSNNFRRILRDRGVIPPNGEVEVTEEVLKSVFLPAKELMGASNFVFESTFIDNVKAVRCVSEYPRKAPGNRKNIAEGYAAYHEGQKRIYIFALHECEEKFEDSREVLQRLVSTVRFS